MSLLVVISTISRITRSNRIIHDNLILLPSPIPGTIWTIRISLIACIRSNIRRSNPNQPSQNNLISRIRRLTINQASRTSLNIYARTLGYQLATSLVIPAPGPISICVSRGSAAVEMPYVKYHLEVRDVYVLTFGVFKVLGHASQVLS
jgi:hypothetical protein